MLLQQFADGRCEVENQYTRVVREEGNPRALALLDEVFTLRPHFEWRGMGSLPDSGLALRADADLDAERRFDLPGVRVADPAACQCGEVLKGVHQALGVQGVRHRVHARDPDRDLHGLLRGRLRGVLHLRSLRHVTVPDDVTALPVAGR
jgi:hypothetical protein